ncbi:TPA: hypothetical protein HA251_05350 [Candidatus Woesearchaeota archaeon]|nr:hypothetical protein [Candidatus Woesearchaeota archaeon]
MRSINEKIVLLATNPLTGTKIQRQLIPGEYNVDNLWKIDLAGYWRMLYTLNTGEVEILAIVLDIMDHPDYDKKFGYRKR